jgi:hypothetical protein
MKDTTDELKEILEQLDAEGRKDCWYYAQVLKHSKGIFKPPSAEEWSRLPWSVKVWIVATVFSHSWQRNLAEAWLKTGGTNGRIL